MGANFHTPYADDVTLFSGAGLEVVPDSLDTAIGYLKNIVVHCDGAINYNKATGELTWAGPLRILFVRADGKIIENNVATGGVALTDGQMAYCDLNETNDTTIAASVAAITTGSTSNTKAYNRVVLGYRNTASDDFFMVAMRLPMTAIGSGDMQKTIYDTTDRGYVDQAVLADTATDAAGTTFKIGTGTDADIILQAYNADVNKPGIKYNATDNKWQYTNDGTTWNDFGSSTGASVAFKTIVVSGQTNVVADASDDTLTLIAGTNVTITTNEAGDSITISASGGTSGSANLWQLLL